MLARIAGQLVSVEGGRAQIGIGPSVIDVLVPGSDLDALCLKLTTVVTLAK